MAADVVELASSDSYWDSNSSSGIPGAWNIVNE